jgi:hypothetical protein
MKQYKKNASVAGWYTGMYIVSIVIFIVVLEKIRL